MGKVIEFPRMETKKSEWALQEFVNAINEIREEEREKRERAFFFDVYDKYRPVWDTSVLTTKWR